MRRKYRSRLNKPLSNNRPLMMPAKYVYQLIGIWMAWMSAQGSSRLDAGQEVRAADTRGCVKPFQSMHFARTAKRFRDLSAILRYFILA